MQAVMRSACEVEVEDCSGFGLLAAAASRSKSANARPRHSSFLEDNCS